MRWSRRSTRSTACTFAAKMATGLSTGRFECYLARNGHWLAAARNRQTQSCRRKTFEDMCKGIRARRPAATSPRTRQDAEGQAGGRRRRPQPHGAMAVSGKDIAHPTKSLAVDFLAGGLAALADQPGAWAGVAYIDYRSMEFLIAAGLSDDRSCWTCTQRRSLPVTLPKRVGAAPAGNEGNARGCAIDTRSGCWRSSTACSRSVGRASGFPRSRRTKYLPASGAVRSVLALVGRLVSGSARNRHHADAFRLAMPDRDHRVQRTLDQEFAGAGRRRPKSCGSPASWRCATESRAVGPGARCGADRGAD